MSYSKIGHITSSKDQSRENTFKNLLSVKILKKTPTKIFMCFQPFGAQKFKWFYNLSFITTMSLCESKINYFIFFILEINYIKNIYNTKAHVTNKRNLYMCDHLNKQKCICTYHPVINFFEAQLLITFENA
jgi:hypothetical protein